MKAPNDKNKSFRFADMAMENIEVSEFTECRARKQLTAGEKKLCLRIYDCCCYKPSCVLFEV